MRQQSIDIPEDVLQRAGQEWFYADGKEFGHDILGKVMVPHRDRIKRVLRATQKRNIGCTPDERRINFQNTFRDQLTDLQREILGRIVEEHAEQFDDPWLELDRAVDLLGNYTLRKRGQPRQSKDPAKISTTGLRAAARVVETWWRGLGHGWAYGESGEPMRLAERVLLQAARTIDPNVTATHIRSVMKHPDCS